MNIGDKVQLICGSPTMVVTGISKGEVLCAWFVRGRPKRDSFPEAALRRLSENLKSKVQSRLIALPSVLEKAIQASDTNTIRVERQDGEVIWFHRADDGLEWAWEKWGNPLIWKPVLEEYFGRAWANFCRISIMIEEV